MGEITGLRGSLEVKIQKSELKTFETIDSYEIMKKAAKNSFDYIFKNFQFQKILIRQYLLVF